MSIYFEFFKNLPDVLADIYLLICGMTWRLVGGVFCFGHRIVAPQMRDSIHSQICKRNYFPFFLFLFSVFIFYFFVNHFYLITYSFDPLRVASGTCRYRKTTDYWSRLYTRHVSRQLWAWIRYRWFMALRRHPRRLVAHFYLIVSLASSSSSSLFEQMNMPPAPLLHTCHSFCLA